MIEIFRNKFSPSYECTLTSELKKYLMFFSFFFVFFFLLLFFSFKISLRNGRNISETCQCYYRI